jgi:putative transposase
MLTGISQKCFPDPVLANTLSQWIGCARLIYNAKCDEDRYLRAFAQKYLPVQTYAPIDKQYSQYKSELTPWLKDCPSQIMRNSATIWYKAYIDFLKGKSARPHRKNKVNGNYIWVTNELFRIRWEGSTCVVELGTIKNSAGSMRVKWNKSRIPKIPPKSIWIKKNHAGWKLSFSYEDGNLINQDDNDQHLKHLSTLSADELEGLITPIDRGIAKPIQTDQTSFDLDIKAKRRLAYREKCLKRFQRKLARQNKGSNQHKKTQKKIAKLKEKDTNLKNDFWHKTTHAIASNAKVVVMEDLKLKNMTLRPKPRQDVNGKWLKNGAKAKAGLNKALLHLGLNKFEVYLGYKMAKLNKPIFKISPYQTSQECAHCGYIHPDNRKTQSDFECLSCGHVDNADHNAALVIRKRAMDLILNSGTELVGTQKNVLRLRANHNRSKTVKSQYLAANDDLLKKKVA